MTINMNDSRITSISQLKRFLQASINFDFKGISQKEKYDWIESNLTKFRYFSLRKKNKNIVKNYLHEMTGYSDAQLTRLISKKKNIGKILPSSRKRNTFPTKYDPEDIVLLAETDNAHKRLSGRATKEIFQREYNKFGNKDFQKLSKISVSHIYNLREKNQYKSKCLIYSKTQATKVQIGERRKPDSEGKPGYIRVDSVHQGDKEKVKGVYHINLVDEVTQWEIVGAVKKISERYLKPLLEDLIFQFPFKIINFHSDNGSEYINKVVAKLLNKLKIGQTKSRSRKCNDNALVESKNGSIIRKHIGRNYINQKNAKLINQFYRKYFNIYLNYHRPSGYATIIRNQKGKEKKVYNEYKVPYEKFLSLKNPKQYLREGISLKRLEKIAYEKSDNEFATIMQEEKKKIFKNFKK